MIIAPEKVEKLPKWAAVLFNAFDKWAPKAVHDAIDDLMTEFVERFEIDQRVPERIRLDLQAMSAWWTRKVIGERSWAEFMREIADDARRFGNSQQDALAA